MRYIDADKLQEDFKELHGGKRSLLIDTAPTADVRENVRGEWIDINDENAPINCACSVCGAGIDYRGFANYCPNCGAEMRITK